MLTFPAVHGTSAIAGILEILFFYLVFAGIAFLVTDSPGGRSPIPPPNTLRSWLFLALKIGLILPILQCTLVAVLVVNAPFLWLGFYAGSILLFRWTFSDQRHRCPVCLQLLGQIRIGTSSRTFLQTYGFESICARGHGSLQSPEILGSHSQENKWLDLDDSLNALRSEAARFE